VPTPLWPAQERCCFILIGACNSTERHDKLLVAHLKKLPACRTRSFSNEFVRSKHWTLPGPHMHVTPEYSGLTLSWPAGYICPTYKESFQIRWDNSILLFLHAVIYLEVSLFRWTSQNAFSRETAVYKWYCV